MAEFVEVMRQERRLCAMYHCSRCPLNDFNGYNCMMCPDSTVSDTKIEEIILQWAKENPEPVYPSWTEAWEQLFPTEGRNQLFKTAGDYMCPAYFGEKHRNKQCGKITCWECKREPMHPEVAEKLGIKPKEVMNDAEVH